MTACLFDRQGLLLSTEAEFERVASWSRTTFRSNWRMLSENGENCLRREQTPATSRHTTARRAPGGPIHRSGWYQQVVPHGFEPHCSSIAGVDGASGRELFEFEHTLSIGEAVRVERGRNHAILDWCREGGVEPPRGCPRRISSPLFQRIRSPRIIYLQQLTKIIVRFHEVL
jgi:hypothetical protein